MMPIPSKQDSGSGIIPAGVIEAAAKTKAVLESLKQTAGEVAQFIKYTFGPPVLDMAKGVAGSIRLVFIALQDAVTPIIAWWYATPRQDSEIKNCTVWG